MMLLPFIGRTNKRARLPATTKYKYIIGLIWKLIRTFSNDSFWSNAAYVGFGMEQS